jgi:hypothetical protein
MAYATPRINPPINIPSKRKLVDSGAARQSIREREDAYRDTQPLDTVFNIGAASGTPVDDNDYQIPFTFTGKINKITYALDPPKLSPADIKKLEEATNNSEANK